MEISICAQREWNVLVLLVLRNGMRKVSNAVQVWRKFLPCDAFSPFSPLRQSAKRGPWDPEESPTNAEGGDGRAWHKIARSDLISARSISAFSRAKSMKSKFQRRTDCS